MFDIFFSADEFQLVALLPFALALQCSADSVSATTPFSRVSQDSPCLPHLPCALEDDSAPRDWSPATPAVQSGPEAGPARALQIPNREGYDQASGPT